MAEVAQREIPHQRRIISLAAQTWNEEGKPDGDKLSAESYANALTAGKSPPTAMVKRQILKIVLLVALKQYRISQFAKALEKKNPVFLSGPDVKHAINAFGDNKRLLKLWPRLLDEQIQRARQASEMAAAARVANAQIGDTLKQACAEQLTKVQKNKHSLKLELFMETSLLRQYAGSNVPPHIVHGLITFQLTPKPMLPVPASASMTPAALPNFSSPLSQLLAASAVSALAPSTPAPESSKRERPPTQLCVMCCKLCEKMALNGLSPRADFEAPQANHKIEPFKTQFLCGACTLPFCAEKRAIWGNVSCFDIFHSKAPHNEIPKHPFAKPADLSAASAPRGSRAPECSSN